MSPHIEKIKKIRNFLLNAVQDLSLEQVNEVPAGFNNNIAWNLGHLIAAQQGLCYLRSDAKPVVSDSFFQAYKPGSKPEGPVTQTELDEIKTLLLSTLEQLDKDLANNTFSQYISWTTRYDVTISSIEEAIHFVLFHEGLHLGYIMALKRVIT